MQQRSIASIDAAWSLSNVLAQPAGIRSAYKTSIKEWNVAVSLLRLHPGGNVSETM